MQIYDITRPLTPTLAPWPGDTPYSHHWVMRLADGHAVNVSTLTMSAHTGTHVDAPFHYAADGAKLDAMPLDIHLGPATVVTLEAALNGEQIIRPEHFAGIDLAAIDRLLIKTHAGARPDDVWWDEFPYLSVEAANLLGEQGVRLFGTDAPSVDHVHSKTMEAHLALHRHNVAILENIQLTNVPPGDYELIALPLKAPIDGSPVRAILREHY